MVSSSLLAQLVAPPPTHLQGHVTGATLGDSVFLVYPGHYGSPQRRAALARTGAFELRLPDLATPVPASLPWPQGAPVGVSRREPEEVPAYRRGGGLLARLTGLPQQPLPVVIQLQDYG